MADDTFAPFDYLGRTFRWEPLTKKAGQLCHQDRLADGAIILRLSFQLERVYAQVIVPGTANIRTRRYRYDQEVRLMDCVPA